MNTAGRRAANPKRSPNSDGPNPIVTVRLAGLNPSASPVSAGGCTSTCGCTVPTGFPCCRIAAAADQRASRVCNSVRPAPDARENDMNMA
ncbi:hypothetical protein MAHJHV33_47630 [Mycobacterium avium subsp. hominissuis]